MVIFRFPYAGYVYNGSLVNVGSHGGYWSRTAYSNTSAYGLYFSSSGVNPANYYYDFSARYIGRPIRCVATT